LTTNYTISQIATIVGGQLLSSQPNTEPIRFLLTDSRQSFSSVGTMFIALVGNNHNGHQYIQQCYEKGVRFFLVSETQDTNECPEAQMVLVDNTLTALQQLVIHHRKQFDIPVIGITGSNGKTIVKEWLSQLLAADYKIVKSPKSYNSQIGVPLSVWQMDKDDTLGIFEAGISTTGEMERLAPIVQNTIFLITNIGEAHSEGFSNIEEKITEKLKLAASAELLVYCKDFEEIDQVVKRDYPNKKTLTWSYKQEADLKILHHESTTIDSTITGVYKDSQYKIQLPFTDVAYVENSIHCWLLLLHLGIPFEEISKRFKLLRALPLRLELLAGINNCMIINDGYNNDLDALEIALDFLMKQSYHDKRILVLSDILQSRLNDYDLYTKVALRIDQAAVNTVVGIGKDVLHLEQYMSSDIDLHFYPSTKDFLADKEIIDSINNATVLLKGARPFKFEQIANALIQKMHKTVLEINLSAVSHNLNVYRNQLDADTRLMVMVKASGYGSGSLEIARLLEFEQIDYLAVAYIDEGVELRKAGIQLPIMVMNPELSGLTAMLEYQLEPQVYSFALLQQLIAMETATPIRIHIMLDSGMKRLGFEPEDCEKLLNLLKLHHQRIQPVSVFSHLAASDNPLHDDFTHDQIQTFTQFSDKLTNDLTVKPLRHILNTSGISRFPQAKFDMVRLGIGLYGIDGNPDVQERLQTVCTLKATISQIKTVIPGVSVGYNRMGQVATPSRIGTISIGYADGYFRRFSNGVGQVWVHGRLAPVVGNVCMDMTMIDLTGIPEAEEGDTVEVFGSHLLISDFALAGGTIVYEALTSVSSRVKRVYFRD